METKRVEEASRRQASYSRRRSGIMNNARELAVVCDAQVAIVMLSATGKHHHFCSDGADIKGVLDRYQQATGTSLWTEQYEEMQRTLSHLKAVNRNLRTEIRQRMGEDLDALGFGELRGLEQSVDAALEVVKRSQEVYKNLQQELEYKNLQQELEYKNLQEELVMREDPVFGFMDSPVLGGWDGVAAVEMCGGGGGSVDMYAFGLVSGQPDLHGMAYDSSHYPPFG
ncbi:APETALA3-like MADS-box protein [Hordeum vulgare]|nr:APETALA3-like MADS-box protein [Hordeum vulgare]